MECPSCHHTGYIKVLEYTPARVSSYHIRTSSGLIPRTDTESASITYLCQRCGAYNGHSVDPDFEVPTPPTQAALRELGTWWPRQNEQVTIREDGSAVVAHRMS